MKQRGTRVQVWNFEALKTRGGLCRDDFFMKGGRVISKRASEHSLKQYNQIQSFKNK